jgi:hypothetical protein
MLGRWTKDDKKGCKEHGQEVIDFTFLGPVTWDLWREFVWRDRRKPRKKEYR